MGQARYHWAIRRVVSKEESVRLSLERNKLKVVLLEGIHPSAVEAFTADGYTQIETHPKALEGQALIDAIADAHFVGLRSRTQLTAEVLEQADKVRAAQLRVDEIVDQAQAEVYAVSDGRETTDYVSMTQMSSDILNALEDIEKNQGKLNGVPTGFTDLDELTQGLHGGQMIIVAARPAMGKSTLALDFCRSASIKHGITSLIVSLEMSSQEIAMPMLSAESGVRLSKMQAGKMSDVDWRKVAETTSRMSEAPLYVDDSANITISEIRSKCRRLKQQENLGLVVIDYLQLMSSGKRVESRQQEVSEFSRSLKLLAKELDVPVIALSQLNRGSEQRTDKRPMVSDLRESGSIEQDADMVILLHREDMYNPDSERVGEADMIIAKHRGGPTRTIPLAFSGKYSRFNNMANEAPPQY